MSTGLDEAIKRIQGDPHLGTTVAEHGVSALDRFDLTERELQAIVDAVRRDIAEAGNDVEGFDLTLPTGPVPMPPPVPIPYPNLANLAGMSAKPMR